MILTQQALEQYPLMEREIERLERKIEYYSNYQVPSEHGVVKGSMKEYPYAEKHFVLSGSDVKKDDEIQSKIRQLIITLTERRKDFICYAIEVESELESIDDMEMRQILEYHFIQGKSYREIGDIIHMDYSAISRKVSNFFKKQTECA